MGFREDAINAFRRRFVPQIHYLFGGTFGGYAISHTTADEYVLTARCSEDTLEQLLSDAGFSRNPIASLKVRMDGNTSEGSWVWRPSMLSSYQVHVVLHELADGNGVDVYAHWECSWIRHPYKHYVGRGYDAEKGVEILRRWFSTIDVSEASVDISFEVDSSLDRQLSETLSLSYYTIKDATASIRSRVPVIEINGDENGDGNEGETDSDWWPSRDRYVDSRDGERDRVSPLIVDRE